MSRIKETVNRRKFKRQPEGPLSATPSGGLTDAQVRDRKRQGLSNEDNQAPPKSLGSIIRDNAFTAFNAINLILASLVFWAAWGHPEHLRNLLFLGVVFINTGVSIVQEWRSRREVERLTLMSQPQAVVRRNGREETIPVQDLVQGDLVVMKPGQQLAVDGKLIESVNLTLDESLLTGESNPVLKQADDNFYSGSFVVSGWGLGLVEETGSNTQAAVILKEAKTIRHSRSQIMAGLSTIVKTLIPVVLILGLLLFASKYFSSDAHEIRKLLTTTVAALVGMIPSGLILLTSVAFAVGVYRLAKQETLVHDMSSIESLARIDTLCLDKTGTITSGDLVLEEINWLSDPSPYLGEAGSLIQGQADGVLAWLVDRIGDDNSTARAINQYFEGDKLAETIEDAHLPVEQVVSFSSELKWSGLDLACGSLILGAPDVLLRSDRQLGEEISEASEAGFRILVLAASKQRIAFVEDKPRCPEDLVALAWIKLSDQLRPNARQTFQFFRDQGVAIKLISGDSPDTVAGVAAQAGLDQVSGLCDMSDPALNLTDDLTSWQDLVRTHDIFGRTKPFQKQKILEALQADGHVVAMTGDGVNDVPALKRADCSVAMASGSDAARVTADLVLLDNDLDSMVKAVWEGRKIINNLERVAVLFLSKTIYTILLALAFVFLQSPFPFYPIQLTLISSSTIGSPAFFLALQPNRDRVQAGFLKRVLVRSLPPGLVVVGLVLVLYGLGHYFAWPATVTNNMIVLLVLTLGFLILLRTARPWTGYSLAVCLTFISIALVAVMCFPAFFFLTPIPSSYYLILLFAGLVAWPLMDLIESGLSGWLASKG